MISNHLIEIGQAQLNLFLLIESSMGYGSKHRLSIHSTVVTIDVLDHFLPRHMIDASNVPYLYNGL